MKNAIHKKKRSILLSLKIPEWKEAEITESSGCFMIRKCHTEDFGEFSSSSSFFTFSLLFKVCVTCEGNLFAFLHI